MQSFDHLITTKPHEIRAVFVADLHLSEQTAALNAAFLHFLADVQALPNIQSLYILGDWLDAWLGDDDYLQLSPAQKDRHWLTPILERLKQLAKKTQICVMHGNRDFAIRQRLCDAFGARLIYEPYSLTLDCSVLDCLMLETADNECQPVTVCVSDDASETRALRVSLAHGDRLCTDDKKYQRYRRIIQNPGVAGLILSLPLAFRRKLAGRIKRTAAIDKAHKSATIMDVNTSAVTKAMTDCDILIHGHTHRPNIHRMGKKARIVLGDWRDGDKDVSAVVGVLTPNLETPVRLCLFSYRKSN